MYPHNRRSSEVSKLANRTAVDEIKGKGDVTDHKICQTSWKNWKGDIGFNDIHTLNPLNLLKQRYTIVPLFSFMSFTYTILSAKRF